MGKNTKRILKLQKWAVRAITSSKYNAHTDPLFLKLKLLKVDDVYKLNLLKFHFKYQNETLPDYFNGMFTPTYPAHDYETRQRDQSVVAEGNTLLARNSIRYSLPRELENTTELILDKVSTHSLAGFSNYIKQYYINRYPSTCVIENCYKCKRNDS